jgi:glutamate-ammonia-ligase adenylyltransferase
VNLATRLTRWPRPFDLARGAEAAAMVPGAGPEVSALLAGVGGTSPFLAGLIAREPEWLAAAIEEPEATFATLVTALPESEAALAPDLRRARQRVALLVALADLGGAWDLAQVTGALTRFADAAVSAGLRALVAAEARRDRLPGMTEEDAATGAGMVVMAMGKMGAFELNYSSDIDLICLFDETRFDPSDQADARLAFVRITRRLTQLLSDLTGDGYVFRTDLRLRPDASVTPVCLSMEAAEAYYESVGRTWERAAWIKARPCAGDLAAGARFVERLRPFVWRRHLDFAAIQDAHDMRLRIRDHKRLHGQALDGADVKLGPGGIREIEFFTQTRQLIAGGRDAELRKAGTEAGLAALAAKEWIPRDLAEDLSADYRAHREVEHRLQMMQDAQTQELPASPEGWERLACLMGRDRSDLRAEIAARFSRVGSRTQGFFAPGRVEPMPEISDTAREIVGRWRTYPALRSPRAQEIFTRLRPDLLTRMNRAARPDEALAHFDGFLARLPAGVQLFSLFEANRGLIDLIVDICATAPALAAHLGRNAGVLDAVIGGAFFDPWPGAGPLTALMSRATATGDYEAKLRAVRVAAREWHFRIGVHHLRGLIDAETAGGEYADLAQAVLAALWPEVVADFATRHGAPPGAGAAVLGMGSLGAGWLTAGSDLDLIVIYDAGDAEASSGRRPLPARVYYARLTQALVTSLTALLPEGRLYEVDMRLRPSGRQGPVATSLAAFRAYQTDEAWTWEHLALTRARPVAGSGEIGDGVEGFRRELLAAKGDRVRVLADTAAMRARIAQAKGAAGPWDLKAGPGGVQDIELLAQAGALIAGDPGRSTVEQLAAAERAGLVTDAEQLASDFRLLQRLRTALRLLADTPADPATLGQGARDFLAREAGGPPAEALAQARARAAAAIAAALSGTS